MGFNVVDVCGQVGVDTRPKWRQGFEICFLSNRVSLILFPRFFELVAVGRREAFLKHFFSCLVTSLNHVGPIPRGFLNEGGRSRSGGQCVCVCLLSVSTFPTVLASRPSGVFFFKYLRKERRTSGMMEVSGLFSCGHTHRVRRSNESERERERESFRKWKEPSPV